MKASTKSEVEYGHGAEYWDKHYRHNPEPFDWYLRYSSLKDIFSLYLKKTDNVLIVGCGNSRMSEDIYDEGFLKITNIDLSPLVIGMMREKYRDRETMIWEVMDVKDMETGGETAIHDMQPNAIRTEKFPNETMDTIIIKGTIDMMLCAESGPKFIEKTLKECSRVLKPEGNLIIVSYATPDDRIEMLEKEEYLWKKVNVHAVAKPLASMCATPDTSNPKNMFYIYVCEKVEVDPTADIAREEKMAIVKDLKWDPNK